MILFPPPHLILPPEKPAILQPRFRSLDDWLEARRRYERDPTRKPSWHRVAVSPPEVVLASFPFPSVGGFYSGSYRATSTFNLNANDGSFNNTTWRMVIANAGLPITSFTKVRCTFDAATDGSVTIDTAVGSGPGSGTTYDPDDNMVQMQTGLSLTSGATSVLGSEVTFSLSATNKDLIVALHQTGNRTRISNSAVTNVTTFYALTKDEMNNSPSGYDNGGASGRYNAYLRFAEVFG